MTHTWKGNNYNSARRIGRAGIWLFPTLSLWLNNIMMTSSNGNIFRITGPLCGEFTDHRWIPLTKATDRKLWCFLWSAPEQMVVGNSSVTGEFPSQRASDAENISIWWRHHIESLPAFFRAIRMMSREQHGFWNYQHLDCVQYNIFANKISKLHITGPFRQRWIPLNMPIIW